MADRVEDDVGVLHWAVGGGHAPEERPESREQLVEGEGLRQVFICPGIETRDAVRDLAPRGEQEDRQRIVGGAQTATDFEPVRGWHHHVKNGCVGLVKLDRVQRLATVSRERDLIPLRRKRATERVAHRGFVVGTRLLMAVILAAFVQNARADVSAGSRAQVEDCSLARTTRTVPECAIRSR